MSTGKVFLGLLAGVAAGALIGVLFAPEKGCETRKKIAKKGKDYADDLTRKMNDFIEDMSQKFETVVRKAKDSAENETGNVNSSL
jgi:gas vesicle protein